MKTFFALLERGAGTAGVTDWKMMISHQSWGEVAKWRGTSPAAGLTQEVSRQEVPHCCLPAPL